ncbi:glycoside hydrolase family 5 protein [Deltaproteobacteria bacterium TL4]
MDSEYDCECKTKHQQSKIKKWLFPLLCLTGILGILNACDAGEHFTNTKPFIEESECTALAIGVYPQQFHVETNKIVDEAGNEAVLRGVSHTDPVWQAKGEDPDVGIWGESLFQKMSDWGVKIVRLPIHPAIWRRYGANESLQVIDQAIEWAQKYEMYVAIDFHSIGFPPENDYYNWEHARFGQLYDTSQAEILSFWNTISTHYVTHKTVAFYEIFNEPVRDSLNNYPRNNKLEHWISWKKLSEVVIDTIRSNDPDKIILVGGLQFAYDLSFVLEAPVERVNIAYATHPYPDADFNKKWEIAFEKVKKLFPVFATALGFDESSKPEKAMKRKGRYRDEIMDFLENNKIGWTVWSFSAAFEPGLFLDNDFTLSQSGKFFRRKLQECDR